MMEPPCVRDARARGGGAAERPGFMQRRSPGGTVARALACGGTGPEQSTGGGWHCPCNLLSRPMSENAPPPRPPHFLKQIVEADNASARWSVWQPADIKPGGAQR